MEYKNEGGLIVMKADGEMPGDLLKAIRAMGVLAKE